MRPIINCPTTIFVLNLISSIWQRVWLQSLGNAGIQRSVTKTLTDLGSTIRNPYLELRWIFSVVCLKMRGNCSSNQRPGNSGNSAERDQELIRDGEYHKHYNECIHQVLEQSQKCTETPKCGGRINWRTSPFLQPHPKTPLARDRTKYNNPYANVIECIVCILELSHDLVAIWVIGQLSFCVEYSMCLSSWYHLAVCWNGFFFQYSLLFATCHVVLSIYIFILIFTIVITL